MPPAAWAERRPRPSSARRPQGRVRGRRRGCHRACCQGRRSRPRGGSPRGRSSPDGRRGRTVWRMVRARRGAEQTSTGEEEHCAHTAAIADNNTASTRAVTTARGDRNAPNLVFSTLKATPSLSMESSQGLEGITEPPGSQPLNTVILTSVGRNAQIEEIPCPTGCSA